MLVVPTDRIAFLLAQAAEAVRELDQDVAGTDGEAVDEDEGENTKELTQALFNALSASSPEELYELLAVAEFGTDDEGEESWQSAVSRARAVALDEAVEQLMRCLVLTDRVEAGLERLGISLPEGDVATSTGDEQPVTAESDEETARIAD